MSGLLAGKVWQSALAPDLKPLAAALADIGNDDGTSIYPSVDYVSWLLGKSRRSVQSGLSKLRRTEVLLVIRGGRGGRMKTTEYRLIEANLPKREAWRKGAEVAPFALNRAVCDIKPRSLRHERVQPTAPEPSLPVTNKTGVNARSARKSLKCSECLGAGFLEREKGLISCPKCSPGTAERRKEA